MHQWGLLMKVKEMDEKAGFKLNIQKMKIMASGPITSWQIDGQTMQRVTDLGLSPGLGRTPEKGIQPTPAFLLGGFHGQRSLASYISWGFKESDMSEGFGLSYLCIFLHILFHCSLLQAIEYSPQCYQ